MAGETSFIANINNVAAKIAIIESANDIFDEGVIPILEEIAALDLNAAIDDLDKGTFLGNRKIDIDLALNNAPIATYVEGQTALGLTPDATTILALWVDPTAAVYYKSATVLYDDGHTIEVTFMDSNNVNTESVSSHSEVILHIEQDAAYAAYTLNSSMFQDNAGVIGQLIRAADIVGQTSNLERITLHVDELQGGLPVTANPIYYWGLTTSAFETLSMRAADIIKLGNEITKIIELTNSIAELLLIQTALPELVYNADSLYNNIAILNTIYDDILAITTVSTDIASVVTNADNIVSINTNATNIVAIQNADANATTATTQAGVSTAQAIISTDQAVISTAQAVIATAKSDEIKGVTVAATATGAAGTLALVTYNSTDGAFTFVVPQGIKGDQGDAFTVNAVGLETDKVLYDDQPKGFSFLAIDTSLIYFKLSDVTADWSAGSLFGKGDTGDTGAAGVGVLNIIPTATTNPLGSYAVGGYTDTYTITYTDSTTDTFNVYNGNGIVSTAFTSTTAVSGLSAEAGATDTYTITYTDTTTSTFDVYNGSDTPQIDDTVTAVDTVWSSTKIAADILATASTDTTNFNNNLSIADDTIQKALDTIDNFEINLSQPVVSGSLVKLEAVDTIHTIDNHSLDIDYVIVATDCTVAQSGATITISAETSTTPSYTIQSTTTSIGLADSVLTTKSLTTTLATPILPTPPANELRNIDVTYTFTVSDNSTDFALNLGTADYTYVSTDATFVSDDLAGNIVVGSIVGTSVSIVVQFTVAATYSVSGTSSDTVGTYTTSSASVADSIVIAVSVAVFDIFGDGSAVALYEFENDVTDTGGVYDGTATNVAYEVGVVSGQQAAMIGDGYISTALAATGGAFSVSCAFSVTDITAANGLICSASSNGDTGFLVFVDSTGAARFSIYDGTTLVLAITGPILSLSTAYKVVASFDGTTNVGGGQLYIDTVATAGDSISATFVTNNVTIGAYNPAAARWNLIGSIEHARLFNRAVTSTEVTTLFNEA